MPHTEFRRAWNKRKPKKPWRLGKDRFLDLKSTHRSLATIDPETGRWQGRGFAPATMSLSEGYARFDPARPGKVKVPPPGESYAPILKGVARTPATTILGLAAEMAVGAGGAALRKQAWKNVFKTATSWKTWMGIGGSVAAGMAAEKLGDFSGIEKYTRKALVEKDFFPGSGLVEKVLGVNGIKQGDKTMPHPQVTQVGSWSTGTAVFYRLSDGKIGTWKRNGVWKTWRPYRPVVIPKKWDSRAMSRVATALKRQRKTATKILQLTGGVPRRPALKGAGKQKALPAGMSIVNVD